MKSLKEMWTVASTKKATEVSSKKANKGIVGAVAALAALGVTTSGVFAGNALNNIATSIQTTFKDIYSAVILVSTIIAVALIAVCLILRMVSKNPRTAEEATTWIKRIIITWFLLMLLSVFLNYGLGLVAQSGANTTTPW